LLILSRRRDEKIVIGNDIVITVVALNNGSVRLGIDAPDDIEVDRLEVRHSKEKDRAKLHTDLRPVLNVEAAPFAGVPGAVLQEVP
jgi:carbon storage regulator